MVTADMHALFAPTKPAAERGGERLGGYRSADPYPGLLEALLGKGEASQLLLHLCEQEKVRGGDDQRDGAGGEPVLSGGRIYDPRNVSA